MEYYEENTFLVFDKKTNTPDRWKSSGDLCYYGNEKDAMQDLNSNEFEAKPISECSEELKIEYRKLIDKIL